MKRKSSEKDASQETSSAKKPRYEVIEGAIASESEVSDIEAPPVKRGRSAKAVSKKISRPSTVNGAVNGTNNTGRKDNKPAENASLEHTPPKKTVGRPRGPNWTPSKLKMSDTISTPTRGTNGKKMISTPLKMSTLAQEEGTPTITRNADRSARRKSARNLIERNLGGDESDLEDNEDELARNIYGEDSIGEEDEVEAEEEGDVMMEGEGDPTTPSKRTEKKPKSTRARKRSPTPPTDLPPYELYFLQNRPGRQKTSDNTLASVALLDHEEYFSITRDLEDPHAEEIQYLHELHSNSFNQWQFELSQSFSICIYGWGSKRPLLTKFAEHIYNSQSLDEQENHKIVIVNGYAHTTTFRDLFQTITTAILGPAHNLKLGSQPNEMLESLLSILTEAAASISDDFHLTLIINSIDAPPLRRPVIQNMLSRLASHPRISLIASADHPSFPLLWDSSLRSNYNFLFHDCTTFQPFDAEIDVIDSVHDLLGRSGRRVGGKEGVSFVLKSLPENAKKLFGVLVAEQLAGMDGGADNNDDLDGDDDSGLKRANVRNQNQEAGVEYRVLYQKAVEEFICSSKMVFQTLLKEFYDHQMIESHKDAMGTEILSVPFRKEELETILEDLMS